METEEKILEFIKYINDQFPDTTDHIPLIKKIREISEISYDQGYYDGQF